MRRRGLGGNSALSMVARQGSFRCGIACEAEAFNFAMAPDGRDPTRCPIDEKQNGRRLREEADSRGRIQQHASPASFRDSSSASTFVRQQAQWNTGHEATRCSGSPRHPRSLLKDSE